MMYWRVKSPATTATGLLIGPCRGLAIVYIMPAPHSSQYGVVIEIDSDSTADTASWYLMSTILITAKESNKADSILFDS